MEKAFSVRACDFRLPSTPQHHASIESVSLSVKSNALLNIGQTTFTAVRWTLWEDLDRRWRIRLPQPSPSPQRAMDSLSTKLRLN